jgi:hypothetical protein
MAHIRSTNLILLKAPIGLLLAAAFLVTSCMTTGRGGGGEDDDGSCFEDGDCTAGEEYCQADDPSEPLDGVCAPLVAAGGACSLGSQCDASLFCLVDNRDGDGECSVAPPTCSDGPSCNCDPMLEMCADGGLSCDGSDDSVTLHCNNGPAGGLGDDDDAFGDDDDDDDDDDDSVGGSEFTALTFEVALTATQGAGGAVGIAATYTFGYWADHDNGILGCAQALTVEGVASFATGGVTGCDNCTGKIDFDDSTVVDISPSLPGGEGCDSAQLTADERNYGTALLTSGLNGGWGDLLTMGLIDAPTMVSLGLGMVETGGSSAADLATLLGDESPGRVFTHGGYIHMTEGTWANLLCLGGDCGDSDPLTNGPASPAGLGSSWYGFWMLYTDPADNTYVGADLNGQYGGRSVWIITFGAADDSG